MPNFFNKYPYTDFHELNLDWILETVKNLAAEWASTLVEWHATQIEWQNLYNYVHDYFDNLDVQEEINNKLDEMASTGELATILAPYLGYVTPEMFGAVGDGSTDDTVAVKSAIDTGKPVLLSQQYMISEVLNPISLNGVGNAALIESPATSLRIIKIINDNCIIDNVTIIGNKNLSPDVISEYQHGIDIEADNVKLSNINIKECCGDGLYIGGDRQVKNAVVSNFNINECRRNGISIIDCVNSIIDTGIISDISGASSPEAGIDIEPNTTLQEVNVTINNLITTHCRKGLAFQFFHSDSAHYNININNYKSISDGLAADTSASASVYVYELNDDLDNIIINMDNVTIENPDNYPMRFKNFALKNVHFTVRNCDIYNSSRYIFAQINSVAGGSDCIGYLIDATYYNSPAAYGLMLQRQASDVTRTYKMTYMSNKGVNTSLGSAPTIFLNDNSDYTYYVKINSSGSINAWNTLCATTRPSTGTYIITLPKKYANVYIQTKSLYDVSYTFTDGDTITLSISSGGSPMNDTTENLIYAY